MIKVAMRLSVLILTFAFGTADAGTLRGVVPVVGSTAGGFGSNFRTSMQLSNRTDHVQSGMLVFHPAGAPATDADPKLMYELQPRETVGWEDVVFEMGATGLGSIDLIVDDGGVPALVARAYDDKVTEGTVGTGINLVGTTEALSQGDTTTLIVPRDLERFRFNIGVRTLGTGATITATVYDANGNEHATTGPLAFAPDYFTQMPATDFLGAPLRANDAVAITVTSGEAVLYGTVTDNATNDPSIHVATRENAR